jgi:hypothetical protein
MPLAPSTAAAIVWHGVRARLFPLALLCVALVVFFIPQQEDIGEGKVAAVVARNPSSTGDKEKEGQKPFTRHAILMSGMAVRSGMDCWESQMNAFVDSFGRRQDVYVVLGLGGTGMDPPTDEEVAVIRFYESRPNVRAVLVDYTPAEYFGGTPLASVMSGAPYDHNGPLEKVSMAKNIPLQFWKVLLAWELMEEVTGGPSKHKYDMIVRMRPDLYLPTYAWDGKAANLDEFSSEASVKGVRGGGRASLQPADGNETSSTFGQSIAELGCVDSLYYRSWNLTDDVVPNLNPFQLQVTGGHASPLLHHPPPPGTQVRATIFLSFFPFCSGGFSDYFAWGKYDVMRYYFWTAQKMDVLLSETSPIQVFAELTKKLGVLLGLREEEERLQQPAKSFLLEIRPCDRAIHCLAKWYPNSTVDPSSCPMDTGPSRWRSDVWQA